MLRMEPDERTDKHLKLIEKFCAWHPIFKDIKPMLRRKMFRFLRAKFFKFGEIIVLQGDEAASPFAPPKNVTEPERQPRSHMPYESQPRAPL